MLLNEAEPCDLFSARKARGASLDLNELNIKRVQPLESLDRRRLA
jgi:hypothetical protein